MDVFLKLLNDNQGVLALISIAISILGFTGLTISINKSKTTKGDNSPIQSSNNGSSAFNAGGDIRK